MKLQWVPQYRLTQFLREITAKQPADFKVAKDVIDTILTEQDDPTKKIIGKLKSENIDVKKDNLASVWLLGFCHYYGIGVDNNKDNKERAFTLFRLAAEQGFAAAQYFAGVCYLEGEGVTKDEQMAVEFFQRAADQQNSYGKYFLGLCLGSGNGIEKDEGMSVDRLEAAVQQGNAEAQYTFAMMNLKILSEVSSVDNNIFVLQCLNEAAVQGHPEANKKLSEMFETFKHQASLNNSKAQLCLDWIYQNTAPEFLKCLIDKDDPDAPYHLGLRYSEGNGIAKDEKEPRKCILRQNEGMQTPNILLGYVI